MSRQGKKSIRSKPRGWSAAKPNPLNSVFRLAGIAGKEKREGLNLLSYIAVYILAGFVGLAGFSKYGVGIGIVCFLGSVGVLLTFMKRKRFIRW